MTALQKLLSIVALPDAGAEVEARRRLDQLTKPPGSLGRLEELVVRLCAISGACPPSLRDPVIFTLAADHGVVAQGVSAYPQIVTSQMVENFLRGGAAVNVLARHAGARVVVADLGVAAPLPSHPGLRSSKVAPGTMDMTRGPAMTRAEAVQAVEVGIALVEAERGRGADLVGTGEMGIGNTTAASALVAALTGASVESVTGPGTGVDAEGRRRKIEAVRRALEANRPDPADALDTLAKVGGFEIAGLVGVILAGAAYRLPVVLDGFIAGAAALVAVRLKPGIRGALLAAHRSSEPGHARVLEDLGLEAYLDLRMRLGEGTGAALCISLARAACSMLNEMATFKSAGVTGRADQSGAAG
ncbi:MAG TPA: nicotinate-nucleotide--dimethylbenzimidazole phosphoribosyltransferase [Candidatus Nitrosotalea sp.]|nr:nicotinate-nucleotide--dimethylbenzimidazole phosphoribosyltransferase [Candidatus Nitrosotalea sp.]